MSQGIAVKQDDSAGGNHLAGGQDWFLVGGQPVVLLGDGVTPHGAFPHAAPYMAQGSSWMTIDGVAVCRAGHLASCGHGSTGRPWFTIPD